jgi:uncharacterized protein (TIGR02246 family)
VSEFEKPVLEVLAAYKSAVLAKDLEAFVALYDPDARIFDAWGRWSYDGTVAWRGMASEWFGSLGATQVFVDADEVQVTAGADIATVHAFLTYMGVSPEGMELHAMQNRLTWVLRRSGRAWKIIHEHTSAPADFETAKLILKR